MTEQPEGFHAHDGWYFRRGDDGSVTIQVCASASDPTPVMGLVLDADSWASVVTEVSAAPTAETRTAAEALHSGGSVGLALAVPADEQHVAHQS